MGNSLLDNAKGKLTEVIPGLDSALAEIAGNSSVRTTKLAATFGTVDSLSNVKGTITEINPTSIQCKGEDSNVVRTGILRAVARDTSPPIINDGCFSTSAGSSNSATVAANSSGNSGEGGSGGQVINGFLDKTKTWPTEYRWGESDWHRFTGRPLGEICGGGDTTYEKGDGESSYPLTHENTRYESRVGEIIPAVKTALQTEWEEPKSDKATQYGESWVWASPGGVTMEIDSTLGTQAWRVTHPSNSYLEVDGSGNFTQKTFAKRYDIIAKGHYTFVNDERNTTIQKGDDLHVYGETTILRHMDKTETIMMNNILTILMKNNVQVGLDEEYNILASQNVLIGLEQTVTVAGSHILTVGIDSIMNFGNLWMGEAGEMIMFTAPIIMLN